jgi:hypothetical protein
VQLLAVVIMLRLTSFAWMERDLALGQRLFGDARPDQPFRLDGFSWPSQLGFIDSGMRCATRTVGMSEAQAIAAGLAHFRAEQADAAFEREPGSVPVNVYFHVITASNGEGNLSDATLLAQIDVMNAAYSGVNGRYKYPV